MKIAYVDKQIGPKRLGLIETADQIMQEYAGQGFDLTLRQLYYQFVARGLLPNTERSYKNLGVTVSDGRLAGLLDWDRLVDRTRALKERNSWDTPEQIIRACAYQFHLDWWKDQPFYGEVWVEKEALIGVLQKACDPLDVPFFACKGYVSQSAMWRASERFRWQQRPKVLFYLGDHDPSGLDMTRDINDRLITFDTAVEVTRLALNMDQIEEYQPPPNPAKLSDSRCAKYIEEWGSKSWELDALEPQVLVALITTAVMERIHLPTFEEQRLEEKEHRAAIGTVADHWELVVDIAHNEGE